LGLVLLIKRTNNNLIFGYGFLLLTLLPVSNIFLLDPKPIAEQRLYIPSIGYSFIVGNIVSGLYSEKNILLSDKMKEIVKIILYGILGIFSLITFNRNFIWKNDLSFWKEAVRVNPGNADSNYNLGMEYYNKNYYEEAVKYFEVTSRMINRPEIFYLLGICYDNLNRYKDALESYFQVLKLDSNPLPDVYNNIGIVYEKLGQISDAEKQYKISLEKRPDYKPARFNLAQLYEKQGKINLAKKEYKQFISLTKSQDDLKEAYDKLHKLSGIK